MSDLTPVSAVPRLYRSPISTAARATGLLEGLGKTADDVAASLLARECFGVRGECGACPVAELLLRSDLAPFAVEVYPRYVELFFPDEKIEVPTPPVIKEFVAQFDAGSYDELVRGGAA